MQISPERWLTDRHHRVQSSQKKWAVPKSSYLQFLLIFVATMLIFEEILYLTELNLLSSSLSSSISISLSLLQESFGDKNVISSRDVAILLEEKKEKKQG